MGSNGSHKIVLLESVFNQPFTPLSGPSQTLPGRLTCLIENGLIGQIRSLRMLDLQKILVQFTAGFAERACPTLLVGRPRGLSMIGWSRRAFLSCANSRGSLPGHAVSTIGWSEASSRRTSGESWSYPHPIVRSSHDTIP